MFDHHEMAAQRQAVMRRARRRQCVAGAFLWALSVAVLITLVGFAVTAWLASDRQVTVTVNNEARVCTGSGNSVSCKYLVYTSGGTFEDTDSLLSGKFSSSDLYGQLIDGQSYTFEVRGWRVPVFSHYPNIIRIVSAGARR